MRLYQYGRFALVGPGLIPVIHAQQKEETPKVEKSIESSCCHKKKTQLSIYDSPHHVEYELVDVEPGLLEQYIRTARVAVTGYLGNFQETNERVSNFINTGVEHTKSTYAYMTDDASTVPRAIAITVGGFSGLVLATRRGFFRKLVYGSSGALLVAAVCYPKQATEMSKAAFDKIRTDGFDFVHQYTGLNPRDLTQKLPELPTSETFSSILDLFNKKIRGSDKSEVQGDFGQSNPADKNLYTTRGS